MKRYSVMWGHIAHFVMHYMFYMYTHVFMCCRHASADVFLFCHVINTLFTMFYMNHLSVAVLSRMTLYHNSQYQSEVQIHSVISDVTHDTSQYMVICHALGTHLSLVLC